ncbi:MAG: hypothetical protein WA724_09745 [Candidatus Dormiibacterota bacterium]
MTTSDQSIELALGTVRDQKGEDETKVSSQITGRVELTPADSVRYLTAAGNVGRLQGQFGFKLVERKYHEYSNLRLYLGILLSFGRARITPDRHRLAEALAEQLLDWLASFRLCLDHTETSLKRRFGDGSEQVARYVAATREAYDGSVGYRFIPTS